MSAGTTVHGQHGDGRTSTRPAVGAGHNAWARSSRFRRLDGLAVSAYARYVSFEKRRRGWAVLAVGLSWLASGEASGFTGIRGAQQGRVLASGVAARAQRDVAWQAPRDARRGHAALVRQLGLGESLWDRDTGIPLRLWGAGTPAPGSVASDTVAARSARELLTAHLPLLAPGSHAGDFVLVGNDLGAGIRSVGFQQTFAGRPVIGGQLSFRFKRDRLVAIGSEAFPKITVTLTDAPIAATTAQARARAWILDGVAGSASAGAVEGPFILPVVVTGQKIRYHEVLRVTVEASAPIGRFAVYLDAATGAPIAREQLLHFASGTVAFKVPLRGPQGPRIDLPAPLLGVFVNGVAATTDVNGVVNFADGANASVIAGVNGNLVALINEAGPLATKDLSLPPGGIALWSDPSELIDAQLSAYVHANVVKQRIRSVDPTFTYLDQLLQVTVNIGDICNAFSDGDAINFFQAGEGCENTARISDVVYHEYGHSAHVQGLIPGVGLFEGALSEGIADYLSATITNDASLAPGFFLDSPAEPLRELDPPGDEWRWPDDLTAEVHDDGRIIGGTLWDLRTALINKLGPGPGVAQADHIWFQSIRRAVDIPSMYPEALLADDDDGNLANGTPNECEINVAFNAHGLVGGASANGSVTLGAQTQNGTPVHLEIVGGSKACIDLAATGAVLIVKTSGLIADMTPEPGGFVAVLPNFPDGTVAEYQVQVTFNDASIASFPQNEADPFYQKYFGPSTPLLCTGFEGPPENEGWQLEGEWQWGLPGGQAGDPAIGLAGDNVVGVNLTGSYAPLTGSTLVSPIVSTAGFPTVRLQYARWLNVEDGFFDQASIRVNGESVWENFNSNNGDLSTVSHTDREWRFHDVDISAQAAGGQVQIVFDLLSDAGLELGGWNLDAFCVVGTDEAPPVPVCGDGSLDPGEQCDAGPGNSDVLANACRTNCEAAHCGDAVIDVGEQCDDGDALGGDGCSATCQVEAPTTTSTTTDTPTTSAGEGPASNSDSDSDSETESGSDASSVGTAELDLADRGCACDGGEPRGLPALGLGQLVLAGLRRRRR